MEKLRVDRLDVIRGLSILFVFIFHLSQLYVNYVEMQMIDKSVYIPKLIIKLFSVSPFGQGGTIGVFLFFLLSGYLIHSRYSYQSQILWKDFYLKRFWRIVPIYVLVLVCFYFFSLNSNNLEIYDLLLHLFFAHNFDSSIFYSINPSFWSLAIEVQFYLLFPLLVVLYRKIGVFNVTLIFILISILGQNIVFINQFAFFSTLKFLYIWMFGGVISQYQNELKVYFKFKYIDLFLLIFILCYSRLMYKNILVTNVSFYYIITFLLVSIIFCYLLFKGKISILIPFKVYVKKILILFGAMSYSLYLIHQPLLPIIHKITFYITSYPYFNYLIDIFIIFGVIVLISYVSYTFIESSFISFGSKISKRFKK